jgi:regulator of cell morphogenesis and NO signaling
MTLIYPDMKLCDVLLSDQSLIPVVNRFGIRLGMGDKSIRTICDEMGLDASFFTTILNTYVHEAYFPETRFRTFCAAGIIDYLKKTNLSYERFLMPNIERHLHSFIEQSDPENGNLQLLGKFFKLFKQELTARIERDNTTVFPALRHLSDRLPSEEVTLSTSADPADSIEAKLSDIKLLMIKHLTGDYDDNLCYAVLTAVCNLERDINRNNRIRNKILFPLREALEKLNPEQQ